MRALLLACCLAAVLPALDAVPPPAGEPTWAQEREEVEGDHRGTICLNGLWRFQPARAPGDAPAGAWGWMRVPGAWATRNSRAPVEVDPQWPALPGASLVRGIEMPGVEAAGGGAAWAGLAGLGNADPAWQAVEWGWYERELAVPAAWAGREVRLDLRRLATDAAVWVDGRPAGRIASPAGSLDLSPFLRAGTTATLRLLVHAAASPEAVTVYMGAAADQVFSRKADLPCRGLIGDALLTSRPAGPRLEAVFLRPSVRQGRIDIDLELAGVADGPLDVEVAMLGADGRPERAFAGQAHAAGGRATFGWPWADARRWDLGKPELYTAAVRVRGDGLDDALRQEFGFREVWIDGRDLYLNGSVVRLRPFSFINENDRRWGVAELIDGAIDGMRAAGWDAQELWPWDQAERGTPSWHELWYERAKTKGFAIIAPLLSMRQLIGERWKDPARRAAWEGYVRDQLRRTRNNPAILMWVHSPNVWGTWNDQDPRLLGMRGELEQAGRRAGRGIEQGLEATAAIRRLDPTRPVTAHHGGGVGDVNATNTYPCLAQPQETAEWLTWWRQHGEVPFWAVEFGPFILDYRRGRLTGGWGQPYGAIHTELLASGHLAAWFGAEAYAGESPRLRGMNPRWFVSGQTYGFIPDDWLTPLADRHMAEQLADIYRGWRTIGAAIGFVQWESERGWRPGRAEDGSDADRTLVDLPAFAPGRRGLWFPQVRASQRWFLQPQGATALPRARAVKANNGPTLAWICARERPGDPGAVLAKDHAYALGARLEKQVALINDARETLAWRIEWTLAIDGRERARGAAEGSIPTGTTAFAPIAADLDAAGRGELLLRARLGDRLHEDRLALHVLAPDPRPLPAIELVDPLGDSAALLAAAGAPRVDGAPVRVIGRNALARGGAALAAHEPWVRGGGRLLVLAQDPHWLRTALGWRVGHQVLRRVFPLDAAHPVLAGLDAGDLRDWAGAGSLVEAYPAVGGDDLSPTGFPAHGWHWGNRGSVCSAPIEKPHRSAWRPLLEADFDLAYTPLMELDWGRGRITWCQLDLEARGGADAAADRLLRNLLRHVAEAPLAPAAPGGVRYLGGAADAALLAWFGVAVDPAARLLVAGRGADPAQVAAARAAGAPVLALDAAAVGVGEARVEASAGARSVPAWAACRGLSLSDLHLHHDAPQPVAALSTAAGGEPGAAGWEQGADGLLARAADGALLCLIDPRSLPADRLTYFRHSRWRQTRALAQVLANAGAAFAADGALWSPLPESLPLAGEWRAAVTAPLPAPAEGRRLDDPGLSATARAAVQEGFDDGGWERRRLPSVWRNWGEAWRGRCGEAVFRRAVAVPPALAAVPLELDLGPIDDCDEVWVNGVRVGATGAEVERVFAQPRRYALPPGLVRAGANLVVIRVFNRGAEGQVGHQAAGFALRPRPAPWYHPDHQERYEVADDPHRYYRW